MTVPSPSGWEVLRGGCPYGSLLSIWDCLPRSSGNTPAFTEAISDYPEGLTPQEAWRELGTGNRQPNPKSTEFREPALRIIHRAIVHGIAGRGDSSVGNVMHSDILYLYCMVRRVPCQIAECLIRYLFQVRRQKHTQEIFGGGYVLRLATALGVEAPGPIQPGAPQFVAIAKAIDMAVLVNMRMVRKQGTTYVLREQERAHDREAGPSGTAGDGGASASGGDQEQPIPETAEVPPPRQPEVIIESGFEGRLRELESVIALEFARAEDDRSVTRRTLQALAAASIPDFLVPDLPAAPQRLTDFIRRHTPVPTPDPTPAPAPDSDQQHPSPQP